MVQSAVNILQLLNLNKSSCRNLGIIRLVTIVKTSFITGFKSFWQQRGGGRGRGILHGKFDTYFSVRCDFYKTPYLNSEIFYLRKAICKLRTSAHNLLIETGGYSKVEFCQGRKEFVDFVI